MKDKNWLKHIQEGKGKEISRLFFLEFTTQEKISKILYPKRTKKGKGRKNIAHYVEPIVNIRGKEWDKLGFLEKSKPVFFKDKLKRIQHTYWKIMNLNPLIEFCKQKEILFDEKEKSFLEGYFRDYKIRKKILEEFQNEDIINAILKYYIKHNLIRYFYLLREIEENPKKYSKEIERVNELNNPKNELDVQMKKMHDKIARKTHKKYGSKEDKLNLKTRYIEYLVSISPVNLTNEKFLEYLGGLKRNREMILSLDRKILMALEVYPEIIIDKSTPPEVVKKVERPRRTIHPFDYIDECDLYISIHNLLITKNILLAT